MADNSPLDNLCVLQHVVAHLTSARDVFAVSRASSSFREAVFLSRKLHDCVVWNWFDFQCTPWRQRYLARVLRSRGAVKFVERLVDMLVDRDMLSQLNPTEAVMVARWVSAKYQFANTEGVDRWLFRVCLEPARERVVHARACRPYNYCPLPDCPRTSEGCEHESARGRFDVRWIEKPSDMTMTLCFNFAEMCHYTIRSHAHYQEWHACRLYEPLDPDHFTGWQIVDYITELVLQDQVVVLEQQLHECVRHAMRLYGWRALAMLQPDAHQLIECAQSLGKRLMHARLRALFVHYYGDGER